MAFRAWDSDLFEFDQGRILPGLMHFVNLLWSRCLPNIEIHSALTFPTSNLSVHYLPIPT